MMYTQGRCLAPTLMKNMLIYLPMHSWNVLNGLCDRVRELFGPGDTQSPI